MGMDYPDNLGTSMLSVLHFYKPCNAQISLGWFLIFFLKYLYQKQNLTDGVVSETNSYF